MCKNPLPHTPVHASSLTGKALGRFNNVSKIRHAAADFAINARRVFLGFTLIGAGLAISFPGFAQSRVVEITPPSVQASKPQAIQAILTQYKVVKSKDGKEKLEDASKVTPGDVIEYQVTYKNNSNKSITGLEANLPIPSGLEYQAGSAQPGAARFKVATANGVYAAEPLTRSVAGKSEKIPYVDYRQLRWDLGELPAHGVTTVTARAQVEKLVPATPATLKTASASTTNSAPAPSTSLGRP